MKKSTILRASSPTVDLLLIPAFVKAVQGKHQYTVNQLSYLNTQI